MMLILLLMLKCYTGLSFSTDCKTPAAIDALIVTFGLGHQSRCRLHTPYEGLILHQDDILSLNP